MHNVHLSIHLFVDAYAKLWNLRAPVRKLVSSVCVIGEIAILAGSNPPRCAIFLTFLNKLNDNSGLDHLSGPPSGPLSQILRESVRLVWYFSKTRSQQSHQNSSGEPFLRHLFLWLKGCHTYHICHLSHDTNDRYDKYDS